MNKDTVKGKMKDLEGQIQRKVGEWTGSKQEQIEGAGKQAEGKVQEGLGKVKDAARNVVDRTPAPGKSKEEDLAQEAYQDVNRKGPKSDVVPDRDDDIGEEVA
jgi:uncharacterized protein YjbJ (UPF0337 family)